MVYGIFPEPPTPTTFILANVSTLGSIFLDMFLLPEGLINFLIFYYSKCSTKVEKRKTLDKKIIFDVFSFKFEVFKVMFETKKTFLCSFYYKHKLNKSR